MYLEELEIIGFKSFAQKTKVKFAEGITAVVGPNGSGKSNIVDAIRWVLGEQKSNVLRSQNMENVIFNGSKTRKQLSMAEVTLRVDNNKHVLPSEYNEVSVSRRLYRNGDSKYLLNNTNCRLKDINNLFMDTGMGPDSYSVIELKMVENLLSGRNEERRSLIEEAAGITKYKARRKEAERKLGHVERDLERVNDIVSEVQKNVNSLQRQASKTRRFNKLTEELKEKEVQFYHLQYLDIKEELVSSEKVLKELSEKISSKESDLDEIQKRLSLLEEEKNKLNENFNSKRVDQNKLFNIVSDLKKNIAVNEERKRNLDKDQLRSENSLEELKLTIERQKKRIQELQKIDGNLKSELGNMNLSKEEVEERLKNKQLELEKARIDFNLANSEKLSLDNKIESLKSKKVEKENNTFKIANELQNIVNGIKELIENIENVKNKIESHQKSINDKRQEIEKVKKKLQEESERKIKLENILKELSYEKDKKQIDLESVNSKIKYLNGLIDLDSDAKYLYESGKWKNPDSIFTLSESLGIDKEYVPAFSTLLDQIGKYILAEDFDDAENAFEILKNDKRGKNPFIIKNGFDRDSKRFEKNEDIIDFIFNIPRTDNPTKEFLQNYFSDTVLVKDLEVAKKLILSNKYSAAVTLNGDYISAEGILISGGESKASKQVFGKKEELEKLEKSKKQIQKEIEDLKENISKNKEELSGINEQDLRNQMDKLSSELMSFEKQLSSDEYEIRNIEGKIGLFEERKSNFASELENNKKQIKDIELELNSKESELLELSKNHENVKESFESLQKDVESLRNKSQDEELHFVHKSNELKNNENEIERLERSINSNEKRIEELTVTIDNYSRIKEEQYTDSGKIENDLNENEEKLELLKKEIDEASYNLRSKEDEIKQMSNERSIIERDLNNTRNDHHRLEVRFTELNTRKDNIFNQCREKYNIEPENVLINVEDGEEEPSLDLLRDIISEVKEKLAGIGSVNFMALEEYDKENERLQFYLKQTSDLNSAKDTLTETIEEINETATEKFNSTFSEIRINFKDLFKTLFNEEGECDIILGGDDPLESEIQIKAQPPGKRPNSIEMLSGGEKTLTAIALLFAIYLVKPSPFCILDEVDAPLDDANIERFLKMIKRFSNNTQFLVVTHNKKTMEAADNLYGVTMQEEGLSSIVSVQMNKVEQ